MEEKVLLSDFEERSLTHYGILEKSGRYPWGSGENPYQRLRDFRAYYYGLKKQGLDDETIAKGCGMSVDELKDNLLSTTQKRNQTTIRNAQEKIANVAEAWRLKDKGYSNVAIGERMGVPESTIRTWLKPGADARAKQIVAISDAFKEACDEKGAIDCGVGVEKYLGITKTRMDACVDLLKEEGYMVLRPKIKQLGTGEYTTLKVLVPPGTDYKEFMEAYNNDPSIVKTIGYCDDHDSGEIRKIAPPVSISRDRVYVRYGDEEGPDGATGSDRDGVIQIRPGVEDLDLMDTRYAQVRVAVDDKMYMKGMAIYSNDIPEGYDVVYNVNKKSGSPDEKVFKPMYQKGEDDPFGASTSVKYADEETGEIIYQKDYMGSDGKKHQSALNIVNDQGSWDQWSKTLASQFLSKQSVDLAKKQLGLVTTSKQEEFDEIMSLTNPTIKKKLLEEFADSCDSDAVTLKAASLPRQQTQVILPIPSLKDDEIYAPNFKDGETVVLIRYPHAGTFEIPQLKVNNKNKEGQEVIGKVGGDAVGINSNVAQQLSGADFDGDNVIVIPNNDGKITATSQLGQLKNFDPKIYKMSDDDPRLDPNSPSYRTESQRTSTKNSEMGKVSNLITDMTIKGADPDEIARAVKHSMVVIDSVKHNLDYKQSEIDNRIQELRDIYQAKEEPGKAGGGASTLISRAGSVEYVEKRKQVYSTRDMTPEEKAAWDAGEKVYRKTGDTKKKLVDGEWVDTGKPVTQESTKMAEAKDARSLSSGTAIEEVYADHANTLKALANKARAEARVTPKLEQSPSAKKVYAEEVEALKAKLDLSKKNAPLERQAMAIANATVKAQVAKNPAIANDKDSLKKVENRALAAARTAVSANKGAVQVKITDREWEAIQAGAISDNMLQDILKNTDTAAIKQRATPRQTVGLTDSQVARAKAMAARGLTQAEIAESLGVSTSTISNAIKS